MFLAKPQKPAWSKNKRIREARAARGIPIADGPFEGMSQGGGTSECEMNIDVVEGNGELAVGARTTRKPERKSNRDDHEGGEEVEQGATAELRWYGEHCPDEPQIEPVGKNFRN